MTRWKKAGLTEYIRNTERNFYQTEYHFLIRSARNARIEAERILKRYLEIRNYPSTPAKKNEMALWWWRDYRRELSTARLRIAESRALRKTNPQPLFNTTALKGY